MRNVRFRDELHVRSDLIEHRPHQLDDAMGLLEVDAGSPGDLPKKCNRIESI